MVILTKEKPKILVQENPEMNIKTGIISIAKRGAIINDSTTMLNKMNIRTKFRKAIFNDNGKANNRKQYR